MRVQIVARHCEIPDALQERAREQAEKLQRFDPRVSSAEFVFEEIRHLKRVEGILRREGEEAAVAHGEGLEFHAAIEQMVERLSKILRRRRDQVRAHHGPKLADLALDEG